VDILSFDNRDSWDACLQAVKLVYCPGASFYIIFNLPIWWVKLYLGGNSIDDLWRLAKIREEE